jgi:excisionase family DNA binding protein
MERLLTLQQTADRLNVSLDTVNRRVRSGALPVFRDGARIVRVRDADLRRYIDVRTSEPPLPPKRRQRVTARIPEPSERRRRLWD